MKENDICIVMSQRPQMEDTNGGIGICGFDEQNKIEYRLTKFFFSSGLSTLLYTAECWTLTERDEDRLDEFDVR